MPDTIYYFLGLLGVIYLFRRVGMLLKILAGLISKSKNSDNISSEDSNFFPYSFSVTTDDLYENK